MKLGNNDVQYVYLGSNQVRKVFLGTDEVWTPKPFEFTINTANLSAGSTTNTQFKLPLTTSTGLDCLVEWGDGSSNVITSHTAPAVTHTYPSVGTYSVKITGKLLGWSFNESGDRLKMLNVSQWAGLNVSAQFAFRGCINLTATATDAPLITISSLAFFFQNCVNFNGAIGSWNVSGVTDMSFVLNGATAFNQPIGAWDVSNVTNMTSMFSAATAFNQDIGSWNIGNVTNFANFMAGKTAANYSPSNLSSIYNGWSALPLVQPNISISFQDILYTSAGQAGKDILDNAPNNWTIVDGGVVRNETFQFSVKTDNAGVSTSTQFRMPLLSSAGLYFTVNWGDGTPVETITTATSAIHTYATAGTYTITTVGNLKNWAFNEGGDLLKMLNVFQWAGLEINQFRAFRGCTNLTATATDAPLIASGAFFDRFFQNCPNFNGAIGNWDVSGITDMNTMFEGATAFNQPIGSWNVSNVTTMQNMFSNATAFNQDIGAWNIGNVTNFANFMVGKTAANYSPSNLNSIYNGWSALPSVQPNVSINFGDILYTSAGQSGKNILDFAPNNWTIVDGGVLRTATFEFSVKTNNAGVSASNQFRMPLSSSSGLYFNVNWGDGSPVELITNHTLAIHTYATAGTYTISTVGNLRNWAFNESGDLLKMLNVFQWAGLEINQFRAFRGCTNLTATATDAPLITSGAFFDRFFQNCPNFNGAIGNWDVSGITDMNTMFEGATAFNQDIGGWNVSNVANFTNFMAGKTALNYSAANLASIYNQWSQLTLQPNLTINFNTIDYCDTSEANKQSIVTNFGWNITDGNAVPC